MLPLIGPFKFIKIIVRKKIGRFLPWEQGWWFPAGPGRRWCSCCQGCTQPSTLPPAPTPGWSSHSPARHYRQPWWKGKLSWKRFFLGAKLVLQISIVFFRSVYKEYSNVPQSSQSTYHYLDIFTRIKIIHQITACLMLYYQTQCL